MSAVIVLKQMLVLFSMMAIGMVLWKKGWIDENGQKTISKLVVDIFNPMLVINGIVGYDFSNTTINIGQNMIFVGIYFLLFFVAGLLITFLLGLKRPQSQIYQLMMLFSNIGFIGIPLVTALLGKEYVLYVAFYVLVYNVLLYTYGIYLAIKSNDEKGQEGVRFPIKKILNPGVFGCLIAIIIFVFKIRLPEPVAVFTDYMGNTCIPLSMILIGVSVAQIETRMLFTNVKMYLFLIVKMLLIPIGAALVCRQLPLSDGIYQVFVIECAVPVGSIVTLMAQEYGAKDDSATVGVVLSTLISVATIPIVAIFL